MVDLERSRSKEACTAETSQAYLDVSQKRCAVQFDGLSPRLVHVESDHL